VVVMGTRSLQLMSPVPPIGPDPPKLQCREMHFEICEVECCRLGPPRHPVAIDPASLTTRQNTHLNQTQLTSKAAIATRHSDQRMNQLINPPKTAQPHDTDGRVFTARNVASLFARTSRRVLSPHKG